MKYVALLVAALLVVIDQLTKLLVMNSMRLHERIHVIMVGDFEVLGIFRIQPNAGAAFGILQGKQTFLIAVTSVFLLGLIIYMLSNARKSDLQIWSWSLVIAGGVGNLIDRVFRGEVTDFIKAFFMSNTIFNFADICAVVGTFMLIVSVIKDDINAKKAKKTLEDKHYLGGENNKSEAEIILDE